MHAEVNQDLCISCGACIDTCPDVFGWNEDEKAHSVVDEVPSDMEDLASEAADGCPTEAISVN